MVADWEVTPFWSYFRISGENEAAGAAGARLCHILGSWAG